MSSNPNFAWGSGGYGSGQYGNQPIENQPLGYYLSLLTSEYRTSPNLNAWLGALLQKLDDISQLLVQMDLAFDVDLAQGPQLDILGVILNQPRTVGFQPSNGVSPVLDDPTYRILLKARIAQDMWDGTIDGLQTVWQGLFPGGKITIEDGQNMSATVIPTGVFSSITQDLISNGYIVPRPAAVLYTYIFGTLPAFGFDVNNSYVAGFDVGHFQ